MLSGQVSFRGGPSLRSSGFGRLFCFAISFRVSRTCSGSGVDDPAARRIAAAISSIRSPDTIAQLHVPGVRAATGVPVALAVAEIVGVAAGSAVLAEVASGLGGTVVGSGSVGAATAAAKVGVSVSVAVTASVAGTVAILVGLILGSSVAAGVGVIVANGLYLLS